MSQKDDLKKLGSILGIWAHPDDEAWSSAGLMRIAVLNEQKVGIITATRGSAGKSADESRWPSEKLSEIREQEMHECLACIGGVEHHWMDYKDGTLINQDTEEAVAQLLEHVQKFSPDTIITFADDGMTGHDDHKTVSLWVDEIAKKLPGIRVLHVVQSQSQHDNGGRELDELFNVYFALEEPNIVRDEEVDINIKLDKELLTCKLNCLKAHASQTAQIFDHDTGRKAFENNVSCECYIVSRE